MKGIHCAFDGRLGRDAEIKTARTSGRQFMTLSVIEGDDDDAQWLNVVAWSESLNEIAADLTKGTAVYVEGKLKLRSWEDANGAVRYGLSVSASLVQPLGLIGQKRPKKARSAPAQKTKLDHQAPLEFADGTTAAQGDALPF